MIDEAATGLPFHAASARAVDLYCDGIEAFLAAQVDSCSRPLLACLISHEVLGGSRAQRDLLAEAKAYATGRGRILLGRHRGQNLALSGARCLPDASTMLRCARVTQAKQWFMRQAHGTPVPLQQLRPFPSD